MTKRLPILLVVLASVPMLFSNGYANAYAPKPKPPISIELANDDSLISKENPGVMVAITSQITLGLCKIEVTLSDGTSTVDRQAPWQGMLIAGQTQFVRLDSFGLPDANGLHFIVNLYQVSRQPINLLASHSFHLFPESVSQANAAPVASQVTDSQSAAKLGIDSQGQLLIEYSLD